MANDSMAGGDPGGRVEGVKMVIRSVDSRESQLTLLVSVAKYVTVADMALMAVGLLYGLLLRESLALVVVFFLLAPLGFLAMGSYRLARRWVVRKKAADLGEALDSITLYLDQIPRKLSKYDTELNSRVQFLWDGVCAPSLIADARLLAEARNKIMSESMGKDAGWSIDRSSDSPPVMLADGTRALAQAVRGGDSVEALEIVGNLLAIPFYRGDQPTVSRDTFVSLTRPVVGLLRAGKALNADESVQLLLERIRESRQGDKEDARCQALVLCWLNLRMSFLRKPVERRLSWVWADPSRLLAAQLDGVLDAYRDRDFAGLSEIVNESFDWWTWVPRFVI